MLGSNKQPTFEVPKDLVDLEGQKLWGCGETSNLHKGLRLDVWKNMNGAQQVVGVRLGPSGECPNEAWVQSGSLVASANSHLPNCQDSAWNSLLLPYSSEQVANGEVESPGQGLDNPKPAMGQGDELSLYPAPATPCHIHLLAIPQICHASYALPWRVVIPVNCH